MRFGSLSSWASRTGSFGMRSASTAGPRGRPPTPARLTDTPGAGAGPGDRAADLCRPRGPRPDRRSLPSILDDVVVRDRPIRGEMDQEAAIGLVRHQAIGEDPTH